MRPKHCHVAMLYAKTTKSHKSRRIAQKQYEDRNGVSLKDIQNILEVLKNHEQGRWKSKDELDEDDEEHSNLPTTEHTSGDTNQVFTRGVNCEDGEDCECWDQQEWGGPVQRWMTETPKMSKQNGHDHDPGLVYYCTLKISIGKESHRPIDRLFLKAWNMQMR